MGVTLLALKRSLRAGHKYGRQLGHVGQERRDK
jgi:hypothetical protein